MMKSMIRMNDTCWEAKYMLPARVDHEQNLHQMVVGFASPCCLYDVNVLSPNNFVDHNVGLIVGESVRVTKNSGSTCAAVFAYLLRVTSPSFTPAFLATRTDISGWEVPPNTLRFHRASLGLNLLFIFDTCPQGCYCCYTCRLDTSFLSTFY